MDSSAGTVKWNLDLDDTRFKSKLVSSKKDVSQFGGHTEQESQKMSKALGSVGKAFAKTALVVQAAATAAFGKFVIAGGISRALNIEDAQAKLKGLGHDVKSVETIMDSALKSVKGTAFGLDAAATAAASAVAAGVKPGQDLTRVLSLTGDAATIMGREFGEAGAIINKVLASNKITMEEVNQLHDAGLPILAQLGKEYGKTAEEMREMVTSGEVDSQRFLKALETNIGGAALASGNTTRGAWENMKAAMSRVGAAIVEDIIPKVRDAFGDMTKWFDDNSQKIVDVVGNVVQGILDFGAATVRVAEKVGEYLGPKLEALWQTIKEDLMPALKDIWHNVIEPLIPIVGTTFVFAVGLLIDAVNLLISAFGFLWQGMKDGNPIIWGLIGVLGTLGTALALKAGFDAITSGFNTLTTVTIPNARNKFGALAAFIQTPIVMPAIAVGAALAAIAMVYNEGRKLQALLGSVLDAKRDFGESKAEFIASLGRARREGRISQAEYNRRLSSYTAGLPPELRARGGPVSAGKPYIVGERGPELMVPDVSGSIVPNNQLGSGQKNEYHIGTINISKEVDGEKWLKKLTRNQEIFDNGLTPARNAW